MEIVLEFLTKNCDKTDILFLGREGYPKYPAILFILIQIDMTKVFFARPFLLSSVWHLSWKLRLSDLLGD